MSTLSPNILSLAPTTRQSGLSLIEVLIATLLLGLGLLGMAAMQTQSLKANQSALQRSQAVMLANYMMDALRANRLAAVNGQYNLGTIGTPDSPECSAPTDVNLVTHDQSNWIAAMKRSFGNKASTCGLIFCQSNDCTIKVFWDDSRADGDSQQTIEVVSRI